MTRTFVWAGLIVAGLGIRAGAQESDRAPTTRPSSPAAPERTAGEALGFGTQERILIIHGDDAGMCHSANVGTIEAMTQGVVTSASIMMPCPWVPEVTAFAKEHPNLDFGIHLTLTSEWRSYRWRPVTPHDEIPGLIDPDGYLWRDVLGVAMHAKPEEIERELRAQVQRALDLGIQPTHVDTHMGTVFARPDFFAAYRKVANEFKLPYLLPKLTEAQLARRDAMTRLAAVAIRKQLGDAQEFTLDDLQSIDGDVPIEKQKDFYIDMIRNLKPGITQIIIHCGVEGDELKAVTGSHARRDMDRRAFMDADVRQAIKDEGVRLMTWREIGERQRKYLGLHGETKTTQP